MSRAPVSDYRLELNPPEGDPIAVPVENLDVTVRHTALSTLTVDTAYAPDELEPLAEVFANWDLYWGDGLLMRGILQRVESSDEDGSARTTLEGVGRGWWLERDAELVEYTNEYAHDAIRDYWSRTDFDAEVIEPEPQLVSEDETLQTADVTSEFEGLLSISSTDPVEIVDGKVAVLRSCYFVDGANNHEFDDQNATGPFYEREDLSHGAGRYIQAASDGDEATFYFRSEYDIPDGQAFLDYRVDATNGSHPEFDLIIDGTTIDTFNEDGLLGGLQWRSVYAGDGFSEGDHTVKFVATTDSDSRLIIDCISVSDARFSYTWDNDVHEPNGYLDGPELYPDAAELEFAAAETAFNIVTGRITSDWTNTDNGQSLALSFDGGETWQDESNTETFEVDSEIATQTVQGRATLSRFGGPRDTYSPRYGFKGQSLDLWELSVDTDSRGIIEQQVFDRTHLDTLQKLHDRANMRFVIDHTAEDAQKATSFPAGERGPDVEWRSTSATRDRNLGDYANQVILVGAMKPEDQREDEDDYRYIAEVTDDTEVERLMERGLSEESATIPVVEIDRNVDTQIGANQTAASLLSDRVRERELTGSLDIQPTLIPPGWSYPVPEFDDRELALEEVQFAPLTGALEFREAETLVPEITRLAKSLSDIEQLF